MMKIVGISGSLRLDSQNTALLEAIAIQLEKFKDVDFEIASIDLPLYTGNETRDSLPENVIELREKVDQADALIMTCPEYNWNLTTALKNAVDWISLGGTNSPLFKQVVAIAGVGGGRLGSVRAQMVLRQTLLHNQAWVIPGPEVLIAPSENMFTADGVLTDDFATSLINDLLSQLIKVAPLIGHNA